MSVNCRTSVISVGKDVSLFAGAARLVGWTPAAASGHPHPLERRACLRRTAELEEGKQAHHTMYEQPSHGPWRQISPRVNFLMKPVCVGLLSICNYKRPCVFMGYFPFSFPIRLCNFNSAIDQFCDHQVEVPQNFWSCSLNPSAAFFSLLILNLSQECMEISTTFPHSSLPSFSLSNTIPLFELLPTFARGSCNFLHTQTEIISLA